MDNDEADLWDSLPDYSDVFDRWEIGPFSLRPEFKYFIDFRDWQGIHEAHGLQYQITRHIIPERLRVALDAAIETVNIAVEHSRLESHAAWFKSEAWLPSLDDLTDASREPADIVIQSLDMVGPTESCTEKEIIAAVGLWCIGEYQRCKISNDPDGATWALGQAGLALAEAQLYAGMELENKRNQAEGKKKVEKALNARHENNRKRKKAAYDWFAEHGGQMKKAVAARHIRDYFHVVEDVAKRWVYEFSDGDSMA